MFTFKVILNLLRCLEKKNHCTNSLLQNVFDYQEGDKFGCVADIGWITGHSYVMYGPLANGGTTLLYESTPIYPDPGKIKIQYLIVLQKFQ